MSQKTDYNTKFSEIEGKLNNHNHDKCITTPEFNKFSVDVFDERLKRANLITKTDFDADLKKNSDRVTSKNSKHLLVGNELKKTSKHLMQLILEVKIILKKII